LLLCVQSSDGAVILLSADKGLLPAHHEVELRLKCIGGLCGHYRDALVVIVKGMPPVRIPIVVDVEGSPLLLTPGSLGLFLQHEPIRLEFGQLPASTETVRCCPAVTGAH
jgi:hypothetical protein